MVVQQAAGIEEAQVQAFQASLRGRVITPEPTLNAQLCPQSLGAPARAVVDGARCDDGKGGVVKREGNEKRGDGGDT